MTSAGAPRGETGRANGLSIAIVDDDQDVRELLATALAGAGHRCRTADDGAAGLTILEAQAPDLAFIDIAMPVLDGIELLRRMRAAGIASEVVIVSGDLDVPKAVAAFRYGACDVIQKPFTIPRIFEAVEIACARRQASQAASSGPRDREEGSAPALVGRSAPFLRLLADARRVAQTDATVLIEGETGTGKDGIARAIHGFGPRRGRPFVPVNCGALPAELVESALFGHEKGAFTGAGACAPGFFRAAEGGTIFLDEIGELPLRSQPALLRAIREHEVTPVGSSTQVRVDVRVVAATNRDLLAEVRAGRFREDLYYRLNVVRIVVPPLRARLEDLPLLAEHFVARMNRRYGRRVVGLDPAALEALARHAFPGNVAELENVIERAFALGTADRIGAEDLPPFFRSGGQACPPPIALQAAAEPLATGPVPTIEEAERLLMQRALDATGGNRHRAASLLGVSTKTLYRRWKEREKRAPDPPGGPPPR